MKRFSLLLALCIAALSPLFAHAQQPIGTSTQLQDQFGSLWKADTTTPSPAVDLAIRRIKLYFYHINGQDLLGITYPRDLSWMLEIKVFEGISLVNDRALYAACGTTKDAPLWETLLFNPPQPFMGDYRKRIRVEIRAIFLTGSRSRSTDAITFNGADAKLGVLKVDLHGNGYLTDG
jgi:hypothetical protein